MAARTGIRPSDWDDVRRSDPAGPVWRRHSDLVNRRHVERWLGRRRLLRVLKTDLWDEAVADGVAPALAAHAAEVHGVDVAPLTVAAALARHPWLHATEADVRALPAADGEYEAVLSLSTLDHLPDREAVSQALAEIRRVLTPGGELLLTFDNRANPVVAVRNALPPRLRRATGLVPYPVSVALGARALADTVRGAGLDVLDVTAALHCPRVLAVAAARRAEGWSPGAQERFAARLLGWERLEASPTRQLTGHFVVLRARRP